MSFFGAMYYALLCRTSLTVSSTVILTSPSNYAYFEIRIMFLLFSLKHLRNSGLMSVERNHGLIIPWHPILGVFKHFRGISLQCCKIIKRINIIEVTGID